MVAALLESDGGSPEQIATGWLCDVVKHTWVTIDFLTAAGFPASVVKAVDALTRRKGETTNDYEHRIASDTIAAMVRRAIVTHTDDSATCVAVAKSAPDYESLMTLDLPYHLFTSLQRTAADNGHCATVRSVIRDIIDQAIGDR